MPTAVRPNACARSGRPSNWVVRTSDVEADLYPLLGERGGTKIVVSEHDFNSTPPDLEARFDRLATLGADITKIAVLPQRPGDALRPLELLARATGPTVAIAMGRLGASLAGRGLALRGMRLHLRDRRR